MNEFDLIGFTINNFRVFGEETKFDLAPLTILTGTNSSGKSSFTKALRLLTESYKANGLCELELMNEDLKLGGFEALKNIYTVDNLISFGLLLQRKSAYSTEEEINYFIELTYQNTALRSLKVKKNHIPVFEQDMIKNQGGLTFREKSFIKFPSALINKNRLRNTFQNMSEKSLNQIIDDIFTYLEKNLRLHKTEMGFFLQNKSDILDEFFERIIEELRNVGRIVTAMGFDPDGEPVEEDVLIGQNPSFYDILSPELLETIPDEIQKLHISKYLNFELLEDFRLFPTGILHNLFNRLKFIDGVRAQQQIVYTKANSPGFYETLSKAYFGDKGSLFDHKDFKRLVVDLFKILDPNDEINLKKITGYGFRLEILKNGVDVGLNGIGYGVTQLLPILIKVFLEIESIFIIEEPEGNLHPELQSKLADFFIEATNRTNFNLGHRFIIETHSEYFIRKLQYLVAKEKISAKKIKLYYFNNPRRLERGEQQIKNININADGSTDDDFGPGFFDEATNWKFELLKLNNPQKN